MKVSIREHVGKTGNAISTSMAHFCLSNPSFLLYILCIFPLWYPCSLHSLLHNPASVSHSMMPCITYFSSKDPVLLRAIGPFSFYKLLNCQINPPSWNMRNIQIPAKFLSKLNFPQDHNTAGAEILRNSEINIT